MVDQRNRYQTARRIVKNILESRIPVEGNAEAFKIVLVEERVSGSIQNESKLKLVRVHLNRLASKQRELILELNDLEKQEEMVGLSQDIAVKLQDILFPLIVNNPTELPRIVNGVVCDMPQKKDCKQSVSELKRQKIPGVANKQDRSSVQEHDLWMYAEHTSEQLIDKNYGGPGIIKLFKYGMKRRTDILRGLLELDIKYRLISKQLSIRRIKGNPFLDYFITDLTETKPWFPIVSALLNSDITNSLLSPKSHKKLSTVSHSKKQSNSVSSQPFKLSHQTLQKKQETKKYVHTREKKQDKYISQKDLSMKRVNSINEDKRYVQQPQDNISGTRSLISLGTVSTEAEGSSQNNSLVDSPLLRVNDTNTVHSYTVPHLDLHDSQEFCHKSLLSNNVLYPLMKKDTGGHNLSDNNMIITKDTLLRNDPNCVLQSTKNQCPNLQQVQMKSYSDINVSNVNQCKKNEPPVYPNNNHLTQHLQSCPSTVLSQSIPWEFVSTMTSDKNPLRIIENTRHTKHSVASHQQGFRLEYCPNNVYSAQKMNPILVQQKHMADEVNDTAHDMSGLQSNYYPLQYFPQPIRSAKLKEPNHLKSRQSVDQTLHNDTRLSSNSLMMKQDNLFHTSRKQLFIRTSEHEKIIPYSDKLNVNLMINPNHITYSQLHESQYTTPDIHDPSLIGFKHTGLSTNSCPLKQEIDQDVHCEQRPMPLMRYQHVQEHSFTPSHKMHLKDVNNDVYGTSPAMTNDVLLNKQSQEHLVNNKLLDQCPRDNQGELKDTGTVLQEHYFQQDNISEKKLMTRHDRTHPITNTFKKTVKQELYRVDPPSQMTINKQSVLLKPLQQCHPDKKKLFKGMPHSSTIIKKNDLSMSENRISKQTPELKEYHKASIHQTSQIQTTADQLQEPMSSNFNISDKKQYDNGCNETNYTKNKEQAHSILHQNPNGTNHHFLKIEKKYHLPTTYSKKIINTNNNSTIQQFPKLNRSYRSTMNEDMQSASLYSKQTSALFNDTLKNSTNNSQKMVYRVPCTIYPQYPLKSNSYPAPALLHDAVLYPSQHPHDANTTNFLLSNQLTQSKPLLTKIVQANSTTISQEDELNYSEKNLLANPESEQTDNIFTNWMSKVSKSFTSHKKLGKFYCT